MTSSYTLKCYQTFGNGMRNFFPKSGSSALTFFPHHNVPPSVSFHLKFQLQRLLRRDHIIPISLFFSRQKPDNQLLYTVPV